jgi:hypothetical protein
MVVINPNTKQPISTDLRPFIAMQKSKRPAMRGAVAPESKAT